MGKGKTESKPGGGCLGFVEQFEQIKNSSPVMLVMQVMVRQHCSPHF